MRSIILLLLAVAVVLPCVAGETYVVTLRTPSIPSALRVLGARPAIEMVGVGRKVPDRVQTSAQREALDALRRHVLVTVESSTIIDPLRSLPDVLAIRPLGRLAIHSEALTDDALASDQYALGLLGAQRAWTKATGRGIVVGVLDTGIDWTHPDLVNALAISPQEDINGNGRFDAWSSDVEEGGVRGDLNGRDDDGNGVVDDVVGYDFVDQTVRNIGDDRDRDPIPADEQGHGTSVSGVVAATPNNRIGIAGLAYGARVRTLRAFDATGNAEEDDVASALVYAALTGVDVVNMSFGDGADSPMLRDAVRFASSMGLILVASAGNTGSISRQYPAGYPEVIAVASTNADDLRSPFSSTGSLVALSAPGQSIVTTAVGGRYRTVNGTSFSAPYVASVAAMLREQQAGRTADEVRGIMQERSLDLGAPGWDPLYGAGRLRADAALHAQGPSAMSIRLPRNDDEVDRSRTPRVPVIATIRVAPFVRYSVDVGVGLEPASWTTLATSTDPAFDDTVAVIDATQLAGGLHTVRCAVTCSDGRVLQTRARFTVINPDDVQITKAEIINAWVTDRRTPVVTIRATVPTSMTAMVTTETSAVPVSDVVRFVRSHSITLADTIRSVAQYRVSTTLRSTSGVMADTVLTIDASNEGAPTVSGWRGVGSAWWAGYVLNDVRDVYRDGRKTVLMNDLSSGSFGRCKTVQWDGTQWVARDSTADTWIPRGMGDANGNGLIDVLAHVVGRAILFEQAVPGGSPFARVIFADSGGRNNGAGMADINGDGREELLLLSDSGCIAITYRNGRFERLGLAVNPTPPSFGMSSNRVDEISVAAGDFDGDGATDVAFGDTDGDLVVSSWKDGQFRTTFTFESDGGGGSGYVAGGDVDADGRPDILFGVPDSTQPDMQREYGRDVWTYRLFRSIAPGQFQQVWTEHVAGVRYGIGFRNGVDVAQADATPGEEIIICAFPRLYVFGRTAASSDIVPRWFRADVVTPRFLTADFDGNGIPELGYGVTVPGYGAMTNFAFSEVDTTQRHPTPTALRGRFVSDTTVVLDWMPVPTTRIYQVYESVNNGPFRIVDSTQNTSAVRTLSATTRNVRFAVSAIASTPNVPSSQRSNIVDFTINAPVRFVRLDPDSIDRSSGARGSALTAVFSGDLAVHRIEPEGCALIDPANGDVLAVALSAVAGSARELTVTFPPIDVPNRLAMRVSGLLDATLRPVADTIVPLRIVNAPAASVEIALASVTVNDPLLLTVRFSHNVDASAAQSDRYTLDPVGMVTSVERVDERTLRLLLDPAFPITPRGVTYALTARDVTGTDGAVMTTGPGRTLTFSVVAADADAAYVYPHPIKLGRDGEVTFGGLPIPSTVDVFDARMRPVATFATVDGSGGIRWDVTGADGVRLAPGLYFYRINGTTLKKLVIER